MLWIAPRRQVIPTLSGLVLPTTLAAMCCRLARNERRYGCDGEKAECVACLSLLRLSGGCECGHGGASASCDRGANKSPPWPINSSNILSPTPSPFPTWFSLCINMPSRIQHIPRIWKEYKRDLTTRSCSFLFFSFFGIQSQFLNLVCCRVFFLCPPPSGEKSRHA